MCCMQVNCHPLPGQMALKQNVIKCVDMQKIVFCQVCLRTPLRMTLYRITWMPNMMMAKDLDSMNTNNLPCIVTQCACVTPQSIQNKVLKLRC